MQALLVSTLAVALAEIGDKTQLLALLLAARWRRPWPICLGILAATLANHALAGLLGMLVARWLSPETLRWAIGLGFLAIAAWTLVPDRPGEGGGERLSAHGVLAATFVAFFLAEMGDKTQVATIALATQYQPLWQVVAGTTLGMLIANVPVVWLGARFAQRLPLGIVRAVAAAVFAALGVWVLVHA